MSLLKAGHRLTCGLHGRRADLMANLQISWQTCVLHGRPSREGVSSSQVNDFKRELWSFQQSWMKDDEGRHGVWSGSETPKKKSELFSLLTADALCALCSAAHPELIDHFLDICSAIQSRELHRSHFTTASSIENQMNHYIQKQTGRTDFEIQTLQEVRESQGCAEMHIWH